MEQLWSMSTTLREANRIEGFLETVKGIEGKPWTPKTQVMYQILLIQNRKYLNKASTQTFNKLSEKQIDILSDLNYSMTYEEAEEIFNAKEYADPDMRGRQSFSPLVKLGLTYLKGEDKIVCFTDVGKKLLNNEIEFGDFVLDSFLKFQYPNPLDNGHKNWNSKPFINTLHLIKKVNKLCKEYKMKEKGISKLELGIFALSLKNYKDIPKVAENVLKFRKKYESLENYEEKNEFIETFINNYLYDFKNPVKNVKEYSDNMLRYLRLTKYVYIRGKYSNTYLDLEPRRMIEINSILDEDDGSAKEYDKAEWVKYFGTFGSYSLPFDNIEKLTDILLEINQEIKKLEKDLKIKHTKIHIPENINELKRTISEQRVYRLKLQNLKIKENYRKNLDLIDNVIDALNNLIKHDKTSFKNKFSVELERWVNIALNILNDARNIKPNTSYGDDNEPIFTAPSQVPDIECYYNTFNAICEVTMLKSRDQWYNEGQPVMRHLRSFEEKNDNSYCLFVAPTLHEDTVNTFYYSVKYEFEGKPQKIIPITIKQLIQILDTFKIMSLKNKTFTHKNIKELFDNCVEISKFNDSIEWKTVIENELTSWQNNLIS